MKIILLDDLDKIGRRGETVEVKNGFARNFLFPKKLAIVATAGNMKVWESQRESLIKKAVKAKEEALSLAELLKNTDCKIPARAGEENRLFGSITPQHISEALSKLGFNISKKSVGIEAPIKTLGSHEVKIKLHASVSVDFKVEVVKAS
ncbi:MAG: 50S ribosomal protein L9 [Deltaproteobacteria bacterium]